MKKENINEIKVDSIITMPLGIMMFFYILFSFAIGENKSTNQFILGTLLMYCSWLVVYLIWVKPYFKELHRKIERLEKKK